MRGAMLASLVGSVVLVGCGGSDRSPQASPLTAALASTAPTTSAPGTSRPPTTPTPSTPVVASPVVASVDMRLIAYRPEQISVKPGTRVSWTQSDLGFHTVTSGHVEQGAAGVTALKDNAFDSGQLGTGAAFSHTFDSPGTYAYFCQIHPATMRGEVHVV